MNIFILEDDYIQHQNLEKIIAEVVSQNNFGRINVFATSKPGELIKEIKNTVGSNIYFLDIQIRDELKKRLEIAFQIRTIDPDGIISFITTHSEFAPITYRYKVSGFDFIGMKMAYNV
ncbi:MAG: hypothetical protein ACRCTA_04805 [Bacilli bacterium]